MVVIALFARHYLTLPLGTCSGNGVKYLPEYIKREHVSVRDHEKFPDGTKFDRQTAHEPLRTGELYDGYSAKKESTVHITYPISRDYGLRAEKRGRLDSASTRYLVDLFRMNFGWG